MFPPSNVQNNFFVMSYFCFFFFKNSKDVCGNFRKDYTETEVIESLLLQSCIKFIKTGHVAAVKNITDIIVKLRKSGHVDLHNVSELQIPVSNPEISMLLHESELVSIGNQWRHFDPDYLETFARDHCSSGTRVAHYIISAATR